MVRHEMTTVKPSPISRSKRSMIMHRISGARCWRARSFPLSTLREHSDLSAAIFSTERSICGKSSRRVRCWVTRIIEVRSRVSICAVREAIREAASPVRRATMPLGRSCATSSASASPGHDSACISGKLEPHEICRAIMSNRSQARFLEPCQGKKVTRFCVLGSSARAEQCPSAAV